MKASIYLLAAVALFASCNKMADAIVNKGSSAAVTTGQFIKYTIREGNHYCDQNGYRNVEISEMKFVVRFDSSAIYQAVSPQNQFDINKLYGFSDNGAAHHEYSARIGWRWSDNALRLFAYVYNNGKVVSKEISSVKIGAEVNCSIKVAEKKYVFTVNETRMELPRAATTITGKGYQLYPYFGGDETAPHQVNIWIKAL